MKAIGFKGHLAGLSALLFSVAGCGGGTQAPLASPPAMPSQPSTASAALARIAHLREMAARRGIVHPSHRGSWMAADAKQSNLIYVSDEGGGSYSVPGSVHVYSYPAGKLEGSLTGFIAPEGLCTDKKGDVYVVDAGTLQIYEFVHGGTDTIATYDETPGQFGAPVPYACSVNPKNGRLAVINLRSYEASGSVAGNGESVAVFLNPRLLNRLYFGPIGQIFVDGAYDDRGNLFIVVSDVKGNLKLEELPKTSNKFRTIRLGLTQRHSFGYVRWDGTHVAVEDALNNIVYQVQGSGSKAAIVGSTALAGPPVGPFAVPALGAHGSQATTLIALTSLGSGSSGSFGIGFWKYPDGGPAERTLSSKLDLSYPTSIVVSSGQPL